ncbi:MAG TPA: aldehyde dehydrogenase family protein [Acidimicrobiales bacterium]|nr:aldehyde dehydrogenase family protein [Acidimicrobiales bacterium]
MTETVESPASIQHRTQWIAGQWVEASDGRCFDDMSPYTGEVYARVPSASAADVARAVGSAGAAFSSWAATPPRERQRLFLRAAEIVERRRDDLVAVMALETGAVRAFAGFQVQWAAGFLRLAAQWAYGETGTVIAVDAPNTYAMATRRPLGVVAGFSPWNGAFNLAWRTVAPPLAAGNTVILKPSELAPISAGLVIAEILVEAGFPPEVLQVVTHGPGEAGPIADELFERPEVRAFNFTGSTAVGRMLAERAGRQLKRIALELGGFNPTIVLADANLDDAVETAAFAAFFHQGQICMNTRKLIVERRIADEFLERFSAKASSLRVGDPSDPSSQLGPLIHDLAVENAKRRIDEAVARGAKVALGGGVEGRCFEPTILLDVPPEATMYCEETFAPVVVVEPFDALDDAIAIANSTPYGLTASVLTSDTGRAVGIARRLEAGVVNINGPTMYAEPNLPIGGVKESGWARFGLWSMENFTDRTTVTVHDGPPNHRI